VNMFGSNFVTAGVTTPAAPIRLETVGRDPQVLEHTLPLPVIEFLPEQCACYRNLEPPGIQIIQNRFFVYWVDIQGRVRNDAAVSSEIKLAFNTAHVAWIYAVEGFLQILYYGRFLDGGNCAAALLLARSMILEPERGSIGRDDFENILDQWIMTTGLEIGYFSALCWPPSVIRRRGNSASEVHKSAVLRKQLSTLLASNFHSYGLHKIAGKKTILVRILNCFLEKRFSTFDLKVEQPFDSWWAC